MKNDNLRTLVSEKEKIEIAEILFIEDNHFKSPINIVKAKEKLIPFCGKKRVYVNFLLDSLIQSEFLRKIEPSENLELGKNAVEINRLLFKKTSLLSAKDIRKLLEYLRDQLSRSSVDSMSLNFFTLKIKEFLTLSDTESKSEHTGAADDIREDLMSMKYIEKVCDGRYKLTQTALDSIDPSHSSQTSSQHQVGFI